MGAQAHKDMERREEGEGLTLLGLGMEQRGTCVIISWYAHSSRSVSWMTPSSTSTFPYVAD